MKKLFVILAAAAVVTACTGVPQNATGTPARETGATQAQTPPPPSPEPEFEPQDDISGVLPEAEPPETADVPDETDTLSQISDTSTEEIEEPLSPAELEPPVAAETESPAEPSSPAESLPELAEAEAVEDPVDITEAPAEPPPVVAVTPPPVVSPPPPVTPPSVVPPPRTPPPVTPPPVTPPRVPPPATPPVAPVVPQPIPQPPATPPEIPPLEEIPPAVAQPEVEEEPPAVSPVPRIVQGIPYPTPPVTGRENEDSVFSRIVRAVAGQIVEVPFRGTGWVYLGETGGRQGVFYESRRIDPEGQSFIFRVDLAGVYVLKFYRQDFIRNFIFNDYVQLIVEDAPVTAGADRFGPPVDRGRVVAEPRWPSTIEEASALRGRQPVPAAPDTAAANQTGSQPADSPSASPATPPAATPPVSTTPPPSSAQVPPPVPATPPTTPPATTPSVPTAPSAPTPAPVPVSPPPPSGAVSGNTVSGLPAETSPYAYLEKAREEYDAARIVSALSFLDLFREHFPSGSDEAWWLYGQCYEASSPARDILAALDYYNRLLRDYPQSSRSDETRRRIRYLERYYINIR